MIAEASSQKQKEQIDMNCHEKIFRNNDVLIFISVLLVVILAKWAALHPLSYSIDDYGKILSTVDDSEFLGNLTQGRFGRALLYKAVYYLGAVTPLVNTFYSMLYMVSLVLVGIITTRIWKIEDNLMLSWLVVACIALHPYQAELFTFKSCPLYLAVSSFLAFLSIYISRQNIKSLVIASVCLALALSVYQVPFNMLFIVICFSVAVELLRSVKEEKDISVAELIIKTNLLPRLITMVMGLVVYLAMNKVIQMCLHVNPSGRALFISFDQMVPRFFEIKRTIVAVFLCSEPILPLSIKNVLNIMGFYAVVACFVKMVSKLDIFRACYYTAFLLVVIFVSALSIMGVIMPVQDWWPVPRVLAGASFFWAGVVALAYLVADKGRLSTMIVILSCTVLLGFVGMNNRIFNDQLRVNMRDMHKANRIVAALEKTPGFSGMKKVAIIGISYAYPSPITTMQGDMNISAFGAEWAKLPLLNEVSGYNFLSADKADRANAETYCKDAPKWPNPAATIITNELGVVCL